MLADIKATSETVVRELASSRYVSSLPTIPRSAIRPQALVHRGKFAGAVGYLARGANAFSSAEVIPVCLPPAHSARRAVIGLIFVARRTGTMTAANEVRISKPATRVNVVGSCGRTPNS